MGRCSELRTSTYTVWLTLTCVLLAAVVHMLPLAAADLTPGPAAEISVAPLADNYADSMYPNMPYGKRTILYVGNSYDRPQNVSGPARIYIQFDLSTIPSRAHVVSAEMDLYQMYAPASSQAYEVHTVDFAWNESTMNWKSQPLSNPNVLSIAHAPTEKYVWVSWNVTSAVQAWVNDEAPNYGLMIRIVDERTDVANEASGFYSREYPEKDLQPKLRVFCQNEPPFTFLISTRIAGLPAELSTQVSSDANETITLHGEETGYLLFESGKAHTITAQSYLYAGNSTRYYADANAITASADEKFTVTYETQFLVSVKSDPSGLIQREWSEWYRRGAQVETPPARDVPGEGTDMRLVLDGWYINNIKQTGNPVVFVVSGPANVAARYLRTYNVTVSSPYGDVLGSGWHDAGSDLQISVAPTYVPADGVLGYLGFGMSFDHWTGSMESTDPTVTVKVDKAIQAKAVWREDRLRFLLLAAAIVGLLSVFAVLEVRANKKRSRKSASAQPRKNKRFIDPRGK